jgi:hypothetical protein
VSGKAPISVRRPVRQNTLGATPVSPAPIAPAPVPDINPDSPQALAFAMRGRSAGPSEQPPAAQKEVPAQFLAEPADTENLSPSTVPDGAENQESGVLTRQAHKPVVRHSSVIEESDDDLRPVAIKLPPEVGRKLAQIADRRGSKRTHVAIEVLTAPLRMLAADHRAGRFPELPKIAAGSVRTSIAFALPSDLAGDLSYVLRVRKAVKAQVLTRLLVPAIEELHAKEFTTFRG